MNIEINEVAAFEVGGVVYRTRAAALDAARGHAADILDSWIDANTDYCASYDTCEAVVEHWSAIKDLLDSLLG